MSLFRTAQLCACMIVVTAWHGPLRAIAAEPVRATTLELHDSRPSIFPNEVSQPLSMEARGQAAAPSAEEELSLERLIDEVRARNPSLQAMAATWQAAAQRFPQAVSLEDPMFTAMVAPASFDSDLVNPGYFLQASQKFPWFGKRAAQDDRHKRIRKLLITI